MQFKQIFIGVVLVAAIDTALTLSPATGQAVNADYLELARQTAHWLDAVAVQRENPQGDMTIRWPTVPAESPASNDMLYSGNAGVVLFYLEMYRTTGQRPYLEQAIAGANHLSDGLQLGEPQDAAFWTGVSGIGFVLGEVYEDSKQQPLAQASQRCFDHIVRTAKPRGPAQVNGVEWNDVTDVIGGSAGIGFYLLHRFQRFQDAKALELAIAAGDGLLHAAVPVGEGDARGLRWQMSPTFPREMPNYSHGTAGICDFLAALHEYCRRKSQVHSDFDYDDRFLRAAVQGGQYLESLATRANHRGFIPHHFPEDGPLFYLGWCHGPAGTGLFLNRLAEQTGNRRWKQLGDLLVQKLMECGIPQQRPEGFWNNVGVCCGNAGVASFMIDRYRETGDRGAKMLAESLLQDLVARATTVKLDNGKTGMYWTHAEHRVRPDFLQAQTGLMQGAAGIGILLLKAHSHLTVSGDARSIALPTSGLLPR